MKYINADKLRAEIERELSAHDKVDNLEAFEVGKAWNRGHRNALENLLSLLDTLEQPVSEDLEEAADDHIRKVADAAGHPGWDWETQDIAEAFKAGAEWQARQLLKSSPLPEDTVLFQKGVEEGKRLIMEGAVEGEVVKDISNKLAVTAKNINLDGLRFGDKVRIIILPEEEE